VVGRTQCVSMWGVHMVELARVLLAIMRAVAVRWGSGSGAVGPSTGEECSVTAGWIKGEGWQGFG